MITEIVIPVMDQSGGEFTLAKWLKREGEVVRKGDGLCEVETSKANVEIESNADGILRRILIAEGTAIPSLTVVALIGDADDPLPTVDPFYRVPPELQNKPPPRVFVQMLDTNPTPRPSQPSRAENAGVAGIASPRAKKLAAEHNIDLASIVGTGPDGRIVEDDVRRAIEQRK